LALSLGALVLALGAGGCLHRPDADLVRHREAVDLHAQGLTLEALGEWREAATLHQRSIAVVPTPAAHAHLGRCLMELGDHVAAQSHLERALELSPSYALAETHLLESRARQGQPPELAEEPPIETAEAATAPADETPPSPRAAPAPAEEADPEPEPTPAPQMPEMNQVAGGLPPVEEVRALLFPGLHGEGDPAAMDETRLAASHLDQPEFHMAQARGHEERGDLLDALREYRIAHDLAPRRVEPLLAAAIVHERLNQPSESARLFAQAAEVDSIDPEVHLRWGNHLFRQGDLEGAVAHFERSLALGPRNVRTLNNLGAALRELERPEEAMERLERAVEIDPAYPPPHRNIGNIRAEQGDSAGALAAYEEYVRLGGSESAEVRRWIREIETAPQ
jgi:tetratricopeptide (TPR) repeat protein